MRFCQWVYIDLLRTHVRQLAIGDVGANHHPGSSYQRKELESADKTLKQTSSLIKTFVDEIRFGQCPDIQLAKAAVSECVANVAKSPEARMFLTRLRSKDEFTS